MNPRYRVAIVDDDDGVRQSLSSLLRALGHEVRTFASAEAFLAALEEPPECLLTDIQMPQMNGDVLQLELLARGVSLPTIFMSAYPTDVMRERVMARGAVAFLAKPVDAETISRCLAAALG